MFCKLLQSDPKFMWINKNCRNFGPKGYMRSMKKGQEVKNKEVLQYMLHRKSTLYLSLTVVALTHKWLNTPIMLLVWTALMAKCVNISLIISFSSKFVQRKRGPLITMLSEIYVPNISRGHPWAFFTAIHEVGIVRWMHFLQHPYRLWSKPTFVINLLVLTFALVGAILPRPLWFFDDNSKTKGSSITKFSIPFQWSILHLLWFFCLGHIRSGHQVESRDLNSKKVYARATATVLNRIL